MKIACLGNLLYGGKYKFPSSKPSGILPNSSPYPPNEKKKELYMALFNCAVTYRRYFSDTR